MSSPGFDPLGWPPPRSPRRPGRALLIGVVTGVLLLGLGAMLTDRVVLSWQSEAPGVRSSSPPEPRTTATSSTTPRPEGSGPVVWRTSGFLPDQRIELVVRDSTTIYRIDPRTGRVAATSVPHLGTEGPVTFLAGPQQVLLRADGRPGSVYTVADGQPATRASGVLAQAEQVIAGPPGTVWVTRSQDGNPTTLLSDFTGKPVRRGHSPSRYDGYDWVTADGAGGLLVTTVGGTYQLTGSGPRRITRGTVVAIGSHHYLTFDCDAQLRCSRYLVTRDGRQRRIGPAPRGDYGGGTISSDGRYAAVWVSGSTGQIGWDRLAVLDLSTGRIIHSFENRVGQRGDQSLIWLPGNRLIGLRDGQLFVFTAANRQTTVPDLRLPRRLVQLTLRQGS